MENRAVYNIGSTTVRRHCSPEITKGNARLRDIKAFLQGGKSDDWQGRGPRRIELILRIKRFSYGDEGKKKIYLYSDDTSCEQSISSKYTYSLEINFFFLFYNTWISEFTRNPWNYFKMLSTQLHRSSTSLKWRVYVWSISYGVFRTCLQKLKIRNCFVPSPEHTA